MQEFSREADATQDLELKPRGGVPDSSSHFGSLLPHFAYWVSEQKFTRGTLLRKLLPFSLGVRAC